MKNSKLMKIILVGVLTLMLIVVATQVFADDDDGFQDLTGTISSNTNTTDSDANNTSTDANNTSIGNNTSNNSTTDSLTTSNNTVNNTTNNSVYNNVSNNLSSSYNNSNLPSTGLGETTSVIFIIAVLIISALYAYKKVQDYKNL